MLAHVVLIDRCEMVPDLFHGHVDTCGLGAARIHLY